MSSAEIITQHAKHCPRIITKVNLITFYNTNLEVWGIWIISQSYSCSRLIPYCFHCLSPCPYEQATQIWRHVEFKYMVLVIQVVIYGLWRTSSPTTPTGSLQQLGINTVVLEKMLFSTKFGMQCEWKLSTGNAYSTGVRLQGDPDEIVASEGSKSPLEALRATKTSPSIFATFEKANTCAKRTSC